MSQQLVLKANPNYWDYVHSLVLNQDNTFELDAGQCQRTENEIKGDYRIQMKDDTNGVLELRNVFDYIDYEYTDKRFPLKDVDVLFILDPNPDWIDVTYGGDSVYHFDKQFSRVESIYTFEIDPLIAMQEGCIPTGYEPIGHEKSERVYYKLGSEHTLNEVDLKKGYVCKYPMLGRHPVYDVLKECERLITVCNSKLGHSIKMVQQFRKMYHEVCHAYQIKPTSNEKDLCIVAEYSKDSKMKSFCLIWRAFDGSNEFAVNQIWSESDVVSNEFIDKVINLNDGMESKIDIDSASKFKEQFESFSV